MPRVGFEPKISAGERPKNYSLDRAATGIGPHLLEEESSALLDSVNCTGR